jgi:UDP-N-acetylmuramate dehydrogenase
LSRHTTYGIGGPAELFVRPGDAKELQIVLQIASEAQLPISWLGSGSNLLVSDSGVQGIVISSVGALNNIRIEENRVTSEAGVMLGHLVRVCLDHQLPGIENLVGIPGTIGGALIMNAGAFGGEISTYLHSVRVLNLQGEERVYRRDDLTFGYRSSNLSPDEIIVEAEFRFPSGSPLDMDELKRRVSRTRKESQPLRQRSAGSVFKNPGPGTAAGMLIDQAGLKGVRRGAAEISNHHANFFLNLGEATAEDMAFLIKLAAHTVKQQFGIQLKLEIRTLGFPEEYWSDVGLA